MNKNKLKSRRSLLSLGLSDSKNSKSQKQSGSNETEMIKMLTADGKLVMVDKAALDSAVGKKKTTNKEIMEWRKDDLTKSTNTIL